MGKSAPSPPPAPDYAAAAKEQGTANIESARASAKLSNPNIIGPYGNQTIKYGSGGVFDEAGYNRAREAFLATGSGAKGPAPTQAQYHAVDDGENVDDVQAYRNAQLDWLSSKGVAPTREQYTTGVDMDIPTVTQTLTPEGQATVEAQQRVSRRLANLGEQGIGTAQQVMGQPFNYTGPDVQTSLGQQRPLNYGPEMGQYGQAQGVNAGAYGQAGSVGADQYGQAQGVNAGAYGQASGVNADQFGNLMSRADMSGVAAMPVNAGMTGQQAIMDRLAPQLARQSAATRQQLANQGIASGSEAYRNAMTQEQQGQNDLLGQAALQGIGLDMGANQQGYGQAMGQAGLYNQALGQGFGQASQAQQMRNQAVGQNFGQGLQGNAAINAAIAQNYGQGINSQQLVNQAISQNFGQGATAQSQANAAMGQNYGQAGSSAGLFNQAVGQNFNQGLAAAQFGNTASQDQLQRQAYLRQQPLNEITGLMSGSQIQLPQFQAYQGQQIAPPPIFAGAQAAGQSAMQNYGIGSANTNAANAGLMSGIGTAASIGIAF